MSAVRFVVAEPSWGDDEFDHGPMGLVEISLREEGDRYVIEHGLCDPSAHDALVSVLVGPHWPTLLKYPAAPIEVRTS